MSRYPLKLWSRPWIDVSFLWRHWAVHRVARFNSGRPYTSWRIGPVFIRVFLGRAGP
jgi:hypothetical protein